MYSGEIIPRHYNAGYLAPEKSHGYIGMECIIFIEGVFMMILSDNLFFWIEDFIGVRKLFYGFVNPDKMNLNEKQVFLTNQAKYLSNITNLSDYKKLHLYVDTAYDLPCEIECRENILMEYEYKQDMIKSFVIRHKEVKSHICIEEIFGNDPNEIVIFKGVLLLLPKKYKVIETSKYLLAICEKYKFEAINTDEYQRMFEEIINSYPGCNIITDLGICTDARNCKCKPENVGIVCSQNIYGEIANI